MTTRLNLLSACGAGLLAVCGLQAAVAADLPMRKAPPVVYVAPFSWTGCYIGVSGGYTPSEGNSVPITGTPDLTDSQTLGNVPLSLRNSPDGLIIGGGGGCNLQINSIVLSAETDISHVDANERSAVTQGFANVTTQFRRELSYIGTLRGRIGLAVDRVLFYGTGGLAYAGVKTSASIVPGPGIVGPSLAGVNDDTQTGYVVGGGIEWAFYENWSLKGEYLYYDLGRETLVAPTVGGGPETAFFSYENKGSIIRAGLNYRF